MNGIRKWSSCLVAAMLVAFALPAAAARPQQAPDKSFGVEFLLPKSVTDANGNPVDNPLYTTGTDGRTSLNFPVTAIVYVRNESPPSTAASNASSLRFTLSGLVAVGVACPRANCSIDPTTNTVSVTNISPPIQGKEAYPVTLQVNSCVVPGEAQIVGDVQVFTGSQFTGSQFKPFLNDSTFPFKTKLSERFPFPYDFLQDPTSIADTGYRCGDIACGFEVPVPNIFNSDPTHVMKIIRGANADASCSATGFIDYFVTNDLWSPNTTIDPIARRLHAAWPSGTPSPVFAYRLVRATTTAGWEVGWQPKPGIAVTIPALVCFGGLAGSEPMTIADLPFPKALGVLAQDIKPNADKIKVDTGTNPPPTITGDGLPIRIDDEWMLVTAIGSSSWDVTRYFRQLHSTGATVATTPMPLLTASLPSPYTSPTAAQMCMVWTSTDGTAAWFMDGSDGWVLGR